MLYYTPQIWCSDNTDAIDRLRIQYGTSFCYPVSAVGAHVSAVPNESNGRLTPIETRGTVAMSGTFGYEMDPNRTTSEEREIIKQQVAFFKEHYNLIQQGDYYRLTDPFANGPYTAWEQVSPDGRSPGVSGIHRRPRRRSLLHPAAQGSEPPADLPDQWRGYLPRRRADERRLSSACIDRRLSVPAIVSVRNLSAI